MLRTLLVSAIFAAACIITMQVVGNSDSVQYTTRYQVSCQGQIVDVDSIDAMLDWRCTK